MVSRHKELRVLIRPPKMSDAKDMASITNLLVMEGADIARTKTTTLREEKRRIVQSISSQKRREQMLLLAEIGGRCVGFCEVMRDHYDVSRHVGTLAVSVIEEVRNCGIGRRLVRECIAKSKRTLGLKIIKLYVFESNVRAKRFYERLGFYAVGRIPNGVFHNGQFKDDIIMVKKLV
jgi:RimJ/RimL family protein N-acetyltransferase